MNNRKQKWFLISSLIFPIVVLFCIVIYRTIILHSYPKVIVPIVAYDPRAFLTGHYLVFNLTDTQKNTSFACSSETENIGCWKNTANGWQVSVLDPNKNDMSNCDFTIKGYCDNKAFYREPMYFSIPEKYVVQIGDAINHGRASIELLIKGKNNVQPVRLLIDGQPWHDVIIQQKAPSGKSPE